MPKKLSTKREEAQERQDFYNSLTATQKIKRLNEMFGPGQGAKKERAKLERQLQIELASANYSKSKTPA